MVFEGVCVCARASDDALLCNHVPAFDDLLDGSLLDGRGLLKTCDKGGGAVSQ